MSVPDGIMSKITTVKSPRYGFQISHFADDKWVGAHAKYDGIEIPETRLFFSLLENNTLVIDVGANIGWYSLIAAQRFESREWRGDVIAFEPEKQNYSLLVKNIEDNKFEKRISALELALGTEYETKKLWLSTKDGQPYNRGDHTLNPDTSTNREMQEYQNIDVIPFDSLFEATRRSILTYDKHIFKLDVQRFELDVLKGAKNYLEECASRVHLIIEYDAESQPELFELLSNTFSEISIIQINQKINSEKPILDFCKRRKYTHANLYCRNV